MYNKVDLNLKYPNMKREKDIANKEMRCPAQNDEYKILSTNH